MTRRGVRRVVILRGVPGSGKTTWARAHVDPSAVVCSADDFFLVGGEYRFDPRRIGEAHAACMRKFLLALGEEATTIVVDNTSCSYWEYENYCVAARQWGYAVEIVEFDVAAEDVERVAARNTHGVPAEAVAAMWRRFQESRDTSATVVRVTLKVRWWVDDGQEGGWFEWITPEEDRRRMAIVAACGTPDWE